MTMWASRLGRRRSVDVDPARAHLIDAGTGQTLAQAAR
jgi:hypothetical protein